MSRFLYILIYIDLCFSYNFIDKYNKYAKKHTGDGKGSPEHNRDSRVVFNVAEFMKTEKSLDFDFNGLDEKDSEIEHIQSNYDYSGLINDFTRNSDEYGLLDVKDSDIDNNLKDLLSLEESNNYDSEFVKTDDIGENQKDISNGETPHERDKKCMFRKLKVPFFSHSTATPKSRKANKKKQCMNCNKNVKKEALFSNTNSTLGKTKRLSPFKHHKNLFKKFIGRKKTKEKVIHNCRQFYQNKAQLTENSDAPNEPSESTEQFTTQKDKVKVEFIEESDYSGSENRIRRDENDKVRRLKLLDALEKKIDNTPVMPPTFPKQISKPSLVPPPVFPKQITTSHSVIFKK